MAASGPLPVTQDLSTLRATLQGLLRFLREALSISNAHTVDFYTESVWEQLVDLPPDVVLATLKRFASEAEAPPSDWRPLLGTKRRSVIKKFSKTKFMKNPLIYVIFLLILLKLYLRLANRNEFECLMFV
ncbi:Methyltransferase-Like Protein 25 [Manis pentadactyla]|nr:Methyltransferase-Like Protein 25 [Manis pentadactyla]